MKRSFIALAVLAGSAAAATCAAGTFGGRHFQLAEGDPAVPGRVLFLSQAVQLAENTTQTWVTLTRVGEFFDPRYGKFQITLDMLTQMVGNFDRRVLGQDVFIDVSHRPSDGAAGKIVKLSVETGRLRALVEWTPFGIESIRTRGFTYLSAEFHEKFQDNEKQLQHGCVLIGAGLTIRPVIKQLEPIQLSVDDDDHAAGARVCISPALVRELSTQLSPEPNMNWLEQLRAKYKALGLTDDTINKLLAAAKPAFEGVTDQTKGNSLLLAWEESGKAVNEQLKKLNEGGGQTGNVTITLATPTAAGASAEEVAKIIAQQLDARAKTLADQQTSLTGHLKLLSDTIKAGDTTLTDEGVKALADAVAPLITAVSTEDQVKALAALQISQAQQLSAARKLATLGYNPVSGSVHISVGSSNEVKSLQSTMDTRLGLTKVEGDVKRFYATGGKLLDANKSFAEKVLAQYDAANGAQLHREHKALAAGTGTISDIKVPYAVERTVLREALYNLVSLNFMDVGTEMMAPSLMIPYDYRDTSAAGTLNARIYERQAIQKGGMIQTWDTAYPIPQKLAFSVSNEMQLLMGGSAINYEPIARNVQNLVRIVGEDTEQINLNELARSADEYNVTTITDTLTAQCNGTNAIFVTTKFPVVRPRVYKDLQGTQVGSTTNPIVVTLNSVVRNEYLPNPDGTALATATYYVMDYNLGELRFVNQAGAAVVPTNEWPLTVAYSYTNNAAKIDLDLGSLTVGAKYDTVLTAIGNRRTVVEDDRYYNADMVLMTGGVDNALGQATTFTANGARVGTSLNADGTVGITKGMPTFKVRGPGMMINDNRLLIGQRGVGRMRMMKPWAMGALQEAKNSAGAFIGAKEGYGEQFIASHVPVNLRLAMSSLILYSATGRVARAS